MELLLTTATDFEKGVLTFLMRPDQAMQLVAVRDIGHVVTAIFDAPGRYADRTVEIAGDALTGDAIARHLAHAAGRPITYRRMPRALLEQDEVLARSVTLVDDDRLAGSADLAALRVTFPSLLRFDHWLKGPGETLLADALRPARTNGAPR